MNGYRVSSWCGAALLAGLLAWPLPGAAQDPQGRRERGSVHFGAFVTDPDTSGRLDSNLGFGTELDLEDDLGLETSKTVARIGGYYWFSRKHRVDFSVFQYSRDATKQLDRTIEFGDRTFTVNRAIEAGSDVQIVKAAYTFAPIVRARADFGLVFGLYVGRVDLGLADRALGVEEAEDFTAPLPVVGFRGRYDFTDRITLRGSFEVFSLDAGDASGRLDDIFIGADYSFNDRVALGLAYNTVSMNIDAEDPDGFLGELDWGYDGFLLYVKTDFGY